MCLHVPAFASLHSGLEQVAVFSLPVPDFLSCALPKNATETMARASITFFILVYFGAEN